MPLFLIYLYFNIIEHIDIHNDHINRDLLENPHCCKEVKNIHIRGKIIKIILKGSVRHRLRPE